MCESFSVPIFPFHYKTSEVKLFSVWNHHILTKNFLKKIILVEQTVFFLTAAIRRIIQSYVSSFLNLMPIA